MKELNQKKKSKLFLQLKHLNFKYKNFFNALNKKISKFRKLEEVFIEKINDNIEFIEKKI